MIQMYGEICFYTIQAGTADGAKRLDFYNEAVACN